MGAEKSTLTEIMASAAKRMRTDFEESANLGHRAEKGSVREYDLEVFLGRYMPGNVQVFGSSEIVSADGDRSPQMDIVICDRSTPPLFNRGGYRVVPAECVYAVIEVKSMLDSAQMKKSREGIAAVKRMPKTAYFPQLITPQPTMYGRTYEGYFPTLGYVFAYDSIDLQNFIDDPSIVSYKVQPYHERIDGAWVLGKGMLNWVDPTSSAPNANPEPGLWLGIGKPPSDGDVLLNMILLLSTRMAQVTMPPFNLIPYANNADMADDVLLRGPVDYHGM